ncbi:hypothetical protein BGZ54_000282 [Gamsiella multidivaricata]|nr:hypothetical protein BGZ54_000282 [Gamsiella multidivaricata]
MLLGYYHSPVLFHNIVQGLIPLLVSCRKSSEDLEFATDVCSLAQTLVIHFGDTDNVGSKVQKARTFLDLTRLLDFGANLHLSNLSEKVEPSKVLTTRLRETFTGLSTPRLSIFTPSALYKSLPDWLNDGHQQDAAEFTKILFSRLEDEDPRSKRALSSFHGTLVNQIKCGTCGTASSNKEDFYDLTIPLLRPAPLNSSDLQSTVDVFPSVEELNDENNNKYFCDHCQSLQDAKRVKAKYAPLSLPGIEYYPFHLG